MDLIRKLTPEYHEYLRDESRTVGTADTISFPRTEEEVVNILCSMHNRGICVTIQGGRTGLAAGAVPSEGHVMNFSRMDGVTGCRIDSAGRFYLRVQPGVILSQLRKKIADKKFDISRWDAPSKEAYRAFCEAPEQFFTPDPTEVSATIGGMVSCNASGARSFRYKGTRPHISALRVVLMDGRVLALSRGEQYAVGRKLHLRLTDGSTLTAQLPTYNMPQIKNASGYYIMDNMDAIDLFIGADGTLGVITEIEIALLPLPSFIWGISCIFQSETDAINFVEHIRYAIPDIAAVEFFDSNAISILRAQKQTNPAFAQLPEIHDRMNTVIYVEIHCEEEATALDQLYEIGRILIECNGSEEDTWVARNEADLTRLQFFRHAVPESTNMLIDRRKQVEPTITKLGTDMSVGDMDLKNVMAMYREGLTRLHMESATWGHIGDNHVHVNILPRDKEDFLRGKQLYEEWAIAISAMQGAVSAEHGVGKIKAPYLEIMFGHEHVEEMRALKKQFDPKNLLGRGTLFYQ